MLRMMGLAILLIVITMPAWGLTEARLLNQSTSGQTVAVTHETATGSDADAELIDLESWEKNNSSRYRTSLYKSANKEEWRRQLRLSTFEKLVTAYLKRVNDPDFNYDRFYDTQKRR